MKTHAIHLSQTRALHGAITWLWPRVFGERRPADRALAEYLKAHREFGGRDRRLLSDTLFGLLRWWGWLQGETPDAAIADVASDGARWCRVFLAVALLEDAAPAAIHAYWAQQAGLAEGAYDALRALPDPAARLAGLFPQRAGDFAPGRLVPDWIVPALPPPCDPAQLMPWLQRRPPLWLRAQTAPGAGVVDELRAAGLAPETLATLPGAISLGRARINLQTLAAYRNGRVEVQDVSSQAVAVVCGALPGERWWDVCAGAGGKALVLARAVGDAGRVLATDIRGDALDELQNRARRARLANVKTATLKSQAESGRGPFDGVLVDAPCSGSGTWRRSPWARWQLQPEDLVQQARRQSSLLATGAQAVKPGGTLVYATCSLFRAENEAVVTQFLGAHPEFAPAPFAHPFTGALTGGLLQLWPWDADGDAMFVARLQRAEP